MKNQNKLKTEKLSHEWKACGLGGRITYLYLELQKDAHTENVIPKSQQIPFPKVAHSIY